MIYPFIFSSLTTLIFGAALLAQWRRYPGARFTRDIGLVYLALAITPVLFYLREQSTGAVQLGALLGIFASGLAYVSLLIMGMAQLADRPLSRAHSLAVVGVLGVLMAYPLWQGDVSLAGAIAGSITVVVGLLAWRWLWSSQRSERWAGALLSAMGLIQCTQFLLGTEWVAAQMTANTLLRVVLGLVLLQTALQRAIAEAQRLRQQHEHLTQNAHQGIAIAYAQEIIYCNPAFLKIFGLRSLAEFSPEWMNAGIASDELAAVLGLRQQVLDGLLPVARWDGQRRRRDGALLRLRFAIWRTEWNGRAALQTVITDDTAQHDTLAAMLHQASHDELTGLPNRGALLRRLRERCQTPESFGLVLLDIDRFKLFNDAHGHSLGDEVLKTLAATLQRGLADTAEVSRLGSDGFALQGSNGAPASELAQRVRELLARPLILQTHEFFIDVSMGIALFPQTGGDAESLLRAANAAMHQAKKVAGTSVVVAEQRFVQGSGEVLEQEQALRSGISRREFSLAYQPKVDAASGALLGFEALARWHQPGVGPVNPVQFIGAAERTGLIGALGMLLLSQVCEQVVVWRDAGVQLVPVAVNVSPLQMLDPGFPQQVDSMLKRYGVAAQWITLEVTETAALDNMALAQAQLLQLRDLGLKVALDDFGTGFSSLDMLRTLPLSVVKIDRSLIDPMPAPEAVAVVQAICQLATALKLRVVAEGVETQEQAWAAHQAGCHEIQGYCYARPLTPEMAGQWLRAGACPKASATLVATT